MYFMTTNKYPCLMYHQIATPLMHKYYVSPKMFGEQVEWLSRNGVNSLSLRDISEQHSGNKKVLITFDDGHISNLQTARILHDNGMTGVFYIILDWSFNDPEYLKPDQIREISDMGHDIGVHGRNHDAWISMDDSRLIDDMNYSISKLEGITGKSVLGCSAPGGLVTGREISIIQKNIPCLKYIRTSFPWYNSYGNDVINSVPIGVRTTMNDYVAAIDMKMPFYAKSVLWHMTKYMAKGVRRLLK